MRLRRLLGTGVVAGTLAGLAWAVWRTVQERRVDDGLTWEPQPFPNPPRPVPVDGPGPIGTTTTVTGTDHRPADAAWVAPSGDHCPASHPIKANVRSGIFHRPGGSMYDRTVPDRCYRDPAAAETDGLRASKR